MDKYLIASTKEQLEFYLGLPVLDPNFEDIPKPIIKAPLLT